MICGYSSLVICWSHAIDMSKRKTDTNNAGLSKLNLLILSLFYILLVVLGIVCIIIYVSVKSYEIAWIVMCSAGIFYFVTFVGGFTFYGTKILFALKSEMKISPSSIMEYHFTKFMLMVTCVFFIDGLIALGEIITFVFGYDKLSLFVGLARNQFMDAGLITVVILSCYITFSWPIFEITYGKLMNKVRSFTKNNIWNKGKSCLK